MFFLARVGLFAPAPFSPPASRLGLSAASAAIPLARVRFAPALTTQIKNPFMTTTIQLRLAWLDLRGSSQWLEKLGDLAYAERIHACWLALSQQLQNTNIFIYQYVGDAVILYADSDAPLADLLRSVQQFQTWTASTMDFHFRAAFHQGEVIRIERDGLLFFYGQTLNQLYLLSQAQKKQAEKDIIYSPSVA